MGNLLKAYAFLATAVGWRVERERERQEEIMEKEGE